MFAPCPSCRRHVRVDADACPFCGGACAFAASPAPVARRMSRAAMFAVASSLVVGACSSEPMYGAPVKPFDAGDAATEGGPSDAGADMALYGSPPYDSSADTGPEDTGGNVNMYGAPPDPDAGGDAGA